MDLAPIVLFTYNRPEHTTKVLDALASNPDASRSNLYIYCVLCFVFRSIYT